MGVRITKAQQPWTDAEDCWLTLHYRPLNTRNEQEIAEFLRELRKISKHTRTWLAVQARAKKLQLRQFDIGMLHRSDAARELGISRGTLISFLAAHPEDYPTIRMGRTTFLPDETFERLKAYFDHQRNIPPGWIPSREAAKRLDVNRNYVAQLVNFGLLRGEKRAKGWYIEERSIEAFLRQRDTRNVRWQVTLQDHLTETYRKTKASNREYHVRRKQRLGSTG